MTRLAILADIHGNMPALEAVLDDLAGQSVDEVLVGGDLVGRGPEGSRVVTRIQELGFPCIGGNHEDYLLGFRHRKVPEEWWQTEEWAAARWMAAELTEEAVAYITDLPFALSRPGLRLVHGTPDSNRDGIGPWTRDGELEGHLAGVEERVLVCAHTHRALVRELGDRLVINVGSVGLPFNSDPRAQYAILSSGGPFGWQAELRQVEYDRQRLYEIYEASGFLAGGGVTAALLRLEVEHAKPLLVPFIEWAKRSGHEPCTEHLGAFFDFHRPGESLKSFFQRLQSLG